MSECVVRMELRKNCLDCDLHQIVYGDSYADTDVYCFKEKRFVGKRFGPTKDLARPDWCPIICQLSKGHGRLVSEKDVRWAIDDIVIEIAERIGHVPMTKNETMEYVNRLPTIVLAERNET